LAPVNPALNAGFTSAPQNVGEMYTRGIEVGINGDVYRKGDFTWNVGLTYSTVNNKVTKLVTSGDVIPGGLNNIAQIRVGYPISGLWGGAFTSTAAQRSFVGSAIPTAEWGFNNTFTFKGLTLRALVSGKSGMYRYNATARELADPTRRMHSDYWDMPADRLTPIFNDLTNWIQDASFVKLRQLSLTYNITGKLLNTIGVKRMSVGITGSNLFVWTDYKGLYDVESETSGSGTQNLWVRGVDYWELGMPRTFTGSINIGF
jgi:hypothetical protein